MRENPSLAEVAHTQHARVLPGDGSRAACVLSQVCNGRLPPSRGQCGWGQPTHLRVLVIDLTEAGLLQQDYEEPVGKNKSGSAALLVMSA